MESMRSRITHLEDQIGNALSSSTRSAPPAPPAPPAPSLAATAVSSIETAESRIGGTFYIHHGNPALGQSPKMHRNLTHKKRMYGQSHWMNLSLVLVKDIAQMIDGQTRDPDHKELAEKVFSNMQKCKRIARVIKSQRAPPWPCIPTSELPPKSITDDLVDCYLRTHESVYRILHIPSFRRSYESLWVTDTEPDPTFIVQLKLVLALGAASYDDNFTLRPSAIRWVYEAETWVSNPMLKHRLNLQYLQIFSLHILARETVAVGEDLVYMPAGALLRSAIILGLHRDPIHLPSRTIFANEMHRRLWSTILELCLQAAINSGCPPLLSPDDFDTQPANNFDDDQLENEDAVPRPENDLTQATISIALRKTFPARLAVTKFLNDFSSSGTYEETLQLDLKLRTAYKTLRNTLRAFDSRTGNLPSDFQVRMIDTIIHRYMCVLHAPFFVPSLYDAKYAYSRKATVDSALKMWYAGHPVSESLGGSLSNDTALIKRDDYQRIVTCGHGFLRSATMQSVMMIGVEMKTQLQEDDGLSPTPLRRDLLAILEEAKRWSLRCMEAGETNVKGHVFTTLMLAYAQGLARGLERTEIAKSLIEGAQIAEDIGMAILEKMVEQDMPEQNLGGMAAMSLDLTPEMLAGWESIVSARHKVQPGY
ncbi:hypothetical protein N0V90_010746 [Kalmusia sp. IMI 367209]|nr:hypothetical protein N0V90_010746 [Kalmusia sp. IMI 367209]